MQISVEHNIGDFVRLWDRVTRNQLPFATALALTRTAKSVQDVLRQRLDSQFTIRTRWVAKGIQVEPANKRDTLARMSARVGSLDPFMQRQEEGGAKTARGAVSVPLGIRRSEKDVTRPSKWPAAILRKSGRRKPFVQTLASGRYAGRKAIVQREGKAAYPLKVLYLFLDRVQVEPHWELRATADQIAPRAFPFHIEATLEQALRTAR